MNICSDVFSRSRNSFKNQITDLPVAMAEKDLRIVSANGDEKTVFVVDTTTVREILQQFEKDDEQDRHATLLRGVTLLEPDMTVKEADLEDGEEISLVWSDPFVEMASWTGEDMGKDLYVRIPIETTSIAPWAFADCRDLVKVVIHDSVTHIGVNAFADCSSLAQVEIPNSVTGIENAAFASCSSLAQVEIPDSVTSIGYAAFSGCRSLTGVEIPDSVTSIGAEAFANCSALTEVKINNSLTRIGKTAFAGCTSLIAQPEG